MTIDRHPDVVASVADLVEQHYVFADDGRAVVVGETTGGGAHPRRGFRVADHLEATVPVSRAVNLRTGSNWEGTGVIPDIAAPANEALTTACAQLLER